MNEPEQILKKLSEKGIGIFTKSLVSGRGSDISNTYIFESNDRLYIADTSCGIKRCREIRKFLKKNNNFDILCTHYHNDHIANNGRLASGNTRIYYHSCAAGKLDYLRTNGTGQIVEMARSMRLKPMLERFRMFSRNQLALIMFLDRISGRIPLLILFVTSYLYSLVKIGMIYSGKSKVSLLLEKERKEIRLENISFPGWVINEGLYAFETPGHSDDHVVFYLESAKILFTGDCLNFLTPNDIQFGDIDATFRSFDFIESLVKHEKIEILAPGHYLPVTGNGKILEYIRDSKQKHLEILDIVRNAIESRNGPVDIEELLSELGRSETSELARKVAKLTFPRTTLVFFDVFILKTLQDMNYISRNDGLWEKNE